ncbi:hypothetical protein [Caldicellulosiruptor acetigenus]|nr:hypothetical protein [Caldicellulosiruptor acetigenus]
MKLWPMIIIPQREEDLNTVVEAERGIIEKRNYRKAVRIGI